MTTDSTVTIHSAETLDPATIEYLVWHRESDRPCVRDDSLQLTYSEFASRVDGFASQLQEHGIGAGDVVAVMLPNRAELLVALMAAWRLRATATPVNPAFTAAEAGYADQAHLTREVRDLAGTSPSRLRRTEARSTVSDLFNTAAG